jgi:hypothetical protein
MMMITSPSETMKYYKLVDPRNPNNWHTRDTLTEIRKVQKKHPDWILLRAREKPVPVKK